MGWNIQASAFLANMVRVFVCLAVVSAGLDLSWKKRRDVAAAIVASIAASMLPLLDDSKNSDILWMAAEAVLMLLAVYTQCRGRLRQCFFLLFCFEIGFSLGDFLVSFWLGVVFSSPRFLSFDTFEYQISIWAVRVLSAVILAVYLKKRAAESKHSSRILTWLMGLGLFGVISIPEQKVFPVKEETLYVWSIYCVVLLACTVVYNMGRQSQMEKEIVRLKTEQAEVLERDYRTLNAAYSANARLFHDFHNHMEVLHRYLVQGKHTEALTYLEDLQEPVREITERVWSGDEALDYLTNTKLAAAEQAGIRVEINIEFPRGTSLHSADLCTILGNLLDNALEAAKGVPRSRRYLALTIRRINQMLVIKVENSFEGELRTDGEEIISSKKQSGLHGWGLKSVRAAAEKYDGTVEISAAEHIFKAVVTLCFDTVSL